MNGSLDGIQQEMELLAERAYSYYKQHRMEDALPLYRRAYDAALVIEDREKMVKYKQWEGHCLYHLGRFREALAVLITLSQTAYVVPHEYFSGVIDQIDIAIKLPIDLYRIKILIQEALNAIREYGLQTSRSVLLIEESILAYMRYDYDFALEKAFDALVSHDLGAKIKCNKLVYYRIIMDNLLSLNRKNELKEWLIKLQELNTDRVVLKEIILYGFQAEIALIDDNSIEAYAFAKQRLKCERETDSDCFTSLRLIISAGLAMGKLNEIRHYLAEILLLRHTECGNRRYQIRIICGDYYVAKYRQEHDIRYRRFAEKSYQQALKFGTKLDILFDCDGRQREIAKRLQKI